MFSELQEKHGDAALQDRWSLTKLDGPLSPGEARAFEGYTNKNQGEDGFLCDSTPLSNGGTT